MPLVEKQADYVLALKGNHSTLHQDVADYFDYINKQVKPTDFIMDSYEDVDKGHGRLEIRRCQTIENIDWLEGKEQWADLCSKIHSTIERLVDGHVSEDIRYYISSLSRPAKDMLEIVRSHWQIENKLHWVLDISFGGDDSLIHLPNAAENFSLLRKIALVILKQDKSKGSIKGKRKPAGWDNDFVLSLLQTINSK